MAPLATLRRGIAGSANLRLRAFDREKAEHDLGLLYRLSVYGFAENAFYTPISEADFRVLYTPVLRLFDSEFLLFAKDAPSDPLRFAFAQPNYAEGQVPDRRDHLHLRPERDRTYRPYPRGAALIFRSRSKSPPWVGRGVRQAALIGVEGKPLLAVAGDRGFEATWRAQLADQFPDIDLPSDENPP